MAAWLPAAAALAITVLLTRQQVRRLAWASNDDVGAAPRLALAQHHHHAGGKIQTVTAIESPFDRRAAMAAVQVDTASGRELSQRLHIPYLARDTARALFARLSAQAAQTAFRQGRRRLKARGYTADVAAEPAGRSKLLTASSSESWASKMVTRRVIDRRS